MRPGWSHSAFYRILSLVFAASLVPASLLVGGSWYLNGQVRQQMEREITDALNLAINLEQTLIDAGLTRMRERAVALAGNPALVSAVANGDALQPVLDEFQQALPGADLVTVVDPAAVVRGRAGSNVTGDTVRYGGLIQQVLDGRRPADSVVVIAEAELDGEPPPVLTAVRVQTLETQGSTDPRAGQVIEDGLALVGAAPIVGPEGRIIGVVLVSDILNNDYAIVDEVLQRSPQGLPIHASIALDGVRVTTTVPAVGGGRRAVGTYYSDPVMANLRDGREYRGRALVGGWQWQRTIYLPLRDPSGQVVAGPYVGIPEASFAQLARSTQTSSLLALVLGVISLVGPVTMAYRLARTSIARPLERFAGLLTEGGLNAWVEPDGPAEMSRMAHALNGMLERIRHATADMARVSYGIKAASDDLAEGARGMAANAEAALKVATSAQEAAERVGVSAERAAGRMRDLEVALARIDVGSEEQARALQYASQIVALVTNAVQDARQGLRAVQESTGAAVAAAQHGRHSALRAVATLELLRVETQGLAEAGGLGSADSPDWTQRVERLMGDLDEEQRAASECDSALLQIARSAEQATARLWELSAVQNENCARVGAVSQQMTDLAKVAAGTADNIRSMSGANREVFAEVDAMADGIESALHLVQRATAHVSYIAEAAGRLQVLSERIRTLAAELDQATDHFPKHSSH